MTGLHHEVDDYLTKPFDNAELRARLRNAVINQRRNREFIRRSLLEAKSTENQDQSDLPENNFTNNSPSSEANNQFIEDLKRYLKDEISDENVLLEQIASKFNIGGRQLQRRIKDACTLTFSELRMVVRMDQACALLLTKKSITEIAHELGYSQGSHFTDKFKKLHGITPKEYRAQNRPPNR